MELADGSVVSGRQYVAEGSEARITLAGGAGRRRSGEEVQNGAVRHAATPTVLRSEWSRLTAMKTDADLLIVRSGGGLDYQKGILHDVTGEVVRFDLDGDVLPVKAVEGLTASSIATALPAELPTAICRITDAAGSLWRSDRYRSARVAVDDAGGRERRRVVRKHRTDRLFGGQAALPQRFEARLDRLDAILRRRRAAGRDEAVLRPAVRPRLRLARAAPRTASIIAKGIALHSRTELVYRLPERFSRFLAVAGIADAVRPDGKVRLVVRGDDKVLFEGDVTGSDAPRPIDLDVTGVRRLTILVDFEDGVDRADHLLLCNARVSK